MVPGPHHNTLYIGWLPSLYVSNALPNALFQLSSACTLSSTGCIQYCVGSQASNALYWLSAMHSCIGLWPFALPSCLMDAQMLLLPDSVMQHRLWVSHPLYYYLPVVLKSSQRDDSYCHHSLNPHLLSSLPTNWSPLVLSLPNQASRKKLFSVG